MTMKRYRLAFCGTPQIAVPTLKTLITDPRFDVRAVITQPDMPAGRNLVLTPPPVKTIAESYRIPVFQPTKISQIIDTIRELDLDTIVVLAYAQIIPQTILGLPRSGCINVHGSLLPAYRGASVLQAPLLNGDTETGVTIMKMDVTLDTGPLLRQARYTITPAETADSLGKALAELGAQLLPDTLADYLEGRLNPQAQDDSQATYVKRLEKKDGIIDWTHSAVDIERFVRAMTSWPSAWTWIAGKQLKILEVDPMIISLDTYKPGKTFVYNSNLAVQCGQGALIIKRLQLEGKKAQTCQEFMRGHQEFVGSVLG